MKQSTRRAQLLKISLSNFLNWGTILSFKQWRTSMDALIQALVAANFAPERIIPRAISIKVEWIHEVHAGNKQ